MSSWIKPGAKCVCVDTGGYPLLKEGAVYEVLSYDDGWLRLVGVIDKGRGRAAGWLPKRFRPLLTKTIEQDVQMFKRIADTAPILEDAE